MKAGIGRIPGIRSIFYEICSNMIYLIASRKILFTELLTLVRILRTSRSWPKVLGC